MTIEGPQQAVKIGQEVTFTISLKNNLAVAVSGGYLYRNYEKIEDSITIQAQDTFSKTYTHTVDENDFIYSKMYNV